MSDVLARIRVKETHGIRRFLYPLSTSFDLTNNETDISMSRFKLVTNTGEVVPRRWQDINDGYEWLLEFAVSLAPFAEMELILTTEGDEASLDDPLQLTIPTAGSALISQQKRLRIEIGHDAWMRQVEYDGVPYLRQTQSILRNGTAVTEQIFPAEKQGNDLAAWMQVIGRYPDGCRADTQIDITACKSWASLVHSLEQPLPADEITFHLPLAVTAPILIWDCGVCNGIYGKVQAGTAEEFVWRTQFDERPHAQWSLATAGRVDYIGEVATADGFLSQRWFHLIDSNKSLAVAITDVPDACREMTVKLNIQGDVTITFRLGTQVPASATFGVCYHFLNDIPAIAAATNPQSILLPPTVEVLPA